MRPDSRDAGPGAADELLGEEVYAGYAYAYPHKLAYRPFERPIPLTDLWRDETGPVLLYAHVPFCEMRCGFCNLFTRAVPDDALAARWMDALERQVAAVGEALGRRDVAAAAVGGGTPTWLAPERLARVFDLLASLGADLARVPTSVEVSPGTTTDEHVALLRSRGVSRVSMGIQSFDDGEVGRLGRPQRRDAVDVALGRLRDAAFPVLNVDLIYGGPGQDAASWARTLRTALEWRPEEIFLYPLYVRPLTGLGRRGKSADGRLALYRQGRDALLDAGYRQVSMRQFTRVPRTPAGGGPATRWRCQDDGMVGLGVGARSYTRTVHWSSAYAVAPRAVERIVDDWVARSAHGVATHGFVLDGEEQRRRYAIQSLLTEDGLSTSAWTSRFGTDVFRDLPLGRLVDAGLAVLRDDVLGGDVLVLTAEGVERSDAIGPWLYSDAVRRLVAAAEVA